MDVTLIWIITQKTTCDDQCSNNRVFTLRSFLYETQKMLKGSSTCTPQSRALGCFCFYFFFLFSFFRYLEAEMGIRWSLGTWGQTHCAITRKEVIYKMWAAGCSASVSVPFWDFRLKSNMILGKGGYLPLLCTGEALLSTLLYNWFFQSFFSTFILLKA